MNPVESYWYAIKKGRSGYFFIFPSLFLFITFNVYPMIMAVITSLFKYTNTQRYFDGITNYIKLANDPVFLRSIFNTLIFCVEVVPAVIIFSLLVAISVVNRSELVRSFFRAAFYLPAVCSAVTISIIWIWMYNPIYGLLNYITGIFGYEPINWLGDPRFSLQALVLMTFISSVGSPVILYIAALGGIPKDYYEAAEIDGITPFKKLVKITWPLVKPTTLYIAVTSAIGSFQTFAFVQLMTGGGPYHTTSTIVYKLYESAFFFGDFGTASAMGVFLTFIVVLIAVIQFKLFSTDVEY